MESLRGIAVSPGIVIGRIAVLENDLHRIPRRAVAGEAVVEEIAALDRAIKASIGELLTIQAKATTEMGEEAAKIFLVHIGMLSDKTLTAPIRAKIEREMVSAEYAVSQEFSKLAAKFRSMPDSAFATKVNDIEDLARRLLRHILNEPGHTPSAEIPHGPLKFWPGLLTVQREPLRFPLQLPPAQEVAQKLPPDVAQHIRCSVPTATPDAQSSMRWRVHPVLPAFLYDRWRDSFCVS